MVRSMSAEQPLHRYIADELRRQILDEHLVPGYQLPSEHELARTFGASRGTVRHALNQLRAEGDAESGESRLG